MTKEVKTADRNYLFGGGRYVVKGQPITDAEAKIMNKDKPKKAKAEK